MAFRVWNGPSCTNMQVQSAKIITSELGWKTWVSEEYWFVIDINWTFGQTTIIRRTYDDFFNLQCTLLDLFPEQKDKNSRTLPFLPGKKLVGLASKRRLAEARQADLEGYLDLLIKQNEKISQSEPVIQFFEPRPGRDIPEEPDDFFEITIDNGNNMKTQNQMNGPTHSAWT